MTMSLLFSMAAHAQQDVTRFLGIPVDGSKSEMIHRLKEKGFQYNQSTGALRGEFNGLEVDIYVVTTKNKVSRIMVADVNTVDETNIRIRFNNLCEQFADNPKYTSLADNCMIPEDEDISYEMLVHDKRYEAISINSHLMKKVGRQNQTLNCYLNIRKNNWSIRPQKLKQRLQRSV